MNLKLTLVSVLFWMVFHSSAQQKIYQLSVSGDTPKEALQAIEKQTGLQIYYAPAWLDSMKIDSREFEGTLEEILSKVFANSKINWLVYDGKIILTYNTPVITQLRYDTASTRDVEFTDYVFAREYEARDVKDLEQRTFVIGRKSQMESGGSSILSGYVKNTENNEPLAGTFLQSDISTTTTDARGFFTLKVPNGKSVLQLQYTGMKSTKRNLVVFSDGALNIGMTPDVVVLENVTVQADADRNVSSVQMGVYKFALDKLKNVPKVFGENDILKVALTLPGVQNVGEGAAGLNVRGGKTDQNLILLNNATVYNPFHFFGFFSSFNSDLLASTELYKSSIPANFGGRLSSVLDVKLSDGSKTKVKGKGGIGIITSSLALEVPLKKDKTSLILGGRSTYSDWVLNLVDNEDIKNSNPSFYDASIGIDHEYGKASHFNVTAYYSYDQFKLSTDSLYKYSNFNLALNWRHNFNEKLSARYIATVSNYDYKIIYNVQPKSAFDFGFSIGDVFNQLSFDYTLSRKHSLSGGVDGKLYTIDPMKRVPNSVESNVLKEQVQGEQGLETGLFLADNYTIDERWSAYLGLRYSMFAALGPRNVFTYAANQPRSSSTLLDSVRYNNGEVIKTYGGPEYRVSLRYALDKFRSFKMSYNRTRQYIHALSNSVSISPTDTWKLSGNNVQPQISDQYSIGYFQNFKENTYETSVEVYYKDIQHIIDYKTNANLVLNKKLEADILQGDGRAYGIEFLVRKNTGTLTGWASYTYSRTLQRFVSKFDEETINHGVFFPTNFDKPHVFNFVGNYKLTRRYSLSMNLSYASGRPVTYPTATYEIGGAPVIYFAERNRFRIPDYFRIDIGINMEGNHKIKKLAHGYWSFNIYNLLGRDNPYSVFFKNNGGGKIQGYRLAVLGSPIPSLTYKFEF